MVTANASKEAMRSKSGRKSRIWSSDSKIASRSRARYASRGRIPKAEITASVISTGFPGREGKSMLRRSPSRVTVRFPLSVLNVRRFADGKVYRKRTCAAAKVACPHRSTSTVGVNHRSGIASSRGTTNAVSARLFSAAIALRTSSGNHASSKTTAAGFPPNIRFVKASIW